MRCIRRSWFASSVVVCVLLGSGLVSGCAASRGPSHTRYDSPVVGYRWSVVDVERHGEPIPASATRGAWIAFGHRGALTAYDTMEHFHLRYAATGHGFACKGAFSGAGWTSSRATLDLADAFFRILGAQHVRVAGHGTHLRFSARGYAFRVVRAGTVT